MKELSKTETIKKIDDFFLNVKEKNPEDVKKIKKLAMSHNIPLKQHRKALCKKCLTPYTKSKIRIKNRTRTVTCDNCGNVSRWKI